MSRWTLIAGLMLATTAGSQTVLDTLFDKLRTATDPSAVQALEEGSGRSGPWYPTPSIAS